MKLSTSTEWLFFHLWKKNPDMEISCPGVFVVDTVIYRWAQPYFWYCTNTDGEITRKTKDRILIDNVYNVFVNNPDCEVISLYLTSKDKTVQNDVAMQNNNLKSV